MYEIDILSGAVAPLVTEDMPNSKPVIDERWWGKFDLSGYIVFPAKNFHL